MCHIGDFSGKLKERISVCICTYKRPEMLARALNCVAHQKVDGVFSFEIVVVDNDKNKSAEGIVEEFKKKNQMEISYHLEPVKNIALARNLCIEKSSGGLIAFIDDDEFPVPNWLVKHFESLKKYNSHGALGPVVPVFSKGTPLWLIRSRLCHRPRNRTGSDITKNDLRTGNILISRIVFDEEQIWFDPLKGLTGGEDGDFLSRQLKRGRKFVWCDEAIVYETVPKERWNALYYLKRNWRIGLLAGRNHRKNSDPTIIKNAILFFGYFLTLPVFLFLGKHNWLKILTKIYYNAGSLLSFFRIKSVENIN